MGRELQPPTLADKIVGRRATAHVLLILGRGVLDATRCHRGNVSKGKHDNGDNPRRPRNREPADNLVRFPAPTERCSMKLCDTMLGSRWV